VIALNAAAKRSRSTTPDAGNRLAGDEMEFPVAPSVDLSKVKTGDKVRFTLTAQARITRSNQSARNEFWRAPAHAMSYLAMPDGGRLAKPFRRQTHGRPWPAAGVSSRRHCCITVPKGVT